MGQGPYTYSALVKPNRVLSGLGNRAFKAIGLDVETGILIMPPRVQQGTALANPTYRLTWLDDKDVKNVRKGQG